MSKRKSIFSLALVVSAVVTTSCTLRPKQQQTTVPQGNAPSATSNFATPVQPKSPGPYKTVEIDGVEFRQGRYPQGTYGGKIVRPLINSDPKTFNPWVSADSLSSQVGGMMFPGLLTMDAYSGDMIPDMASEYKVNPDKVTYEVKLRKGLKWSDGKPITADDVEYTYNTIVAKGYGNTSIRDSISVDGIPPKVTVIDPLTVSIKTAKPFVPFLRSLGVPIAPKHVIEPILKQKDGRSRFERLWAQTDDTKIKTLVTSGPFRLANYAPAQRVELVRTDNFYMVDPAGKRLPYMDRIVYLFVPEVNTAVMKFKAKETDISGIRNRDVVTLAPQQQALNFKIYNLGPMTSSNFVMFNLNQRKKSDGKPYVTPYKSAWFNDVNFRQAINHAISRQNIIDGYLRGIGSPSYASMPEISAFLNKNLKPVTADKEVSKQLLAKSGFVLGQDGILKDKDGHKVEFSVLAPAGSPFYDATGVTIVADLKQLGIKANYQPMEFNVLQDKVSGSKDWECVLMGLTSDPFEPNSGANVYRSEGRLHLWDEREVVDGTTVVKDARPWEKELDKIFNDGAQEFDTAKRRAMYDNFQQIMYDQAPFIYLVTPMDFVGARNTVKNFDPTPLSQDVDGLHNLEEIYKENGQ